MTLSGRVFKFNVCSLSAGRACGVFKAESESDIAILADAVRSKRGVSEIDEAQYLEAEKKSSQTQSLLSLKGYAPRVVQPPILPALAVEAVPGVASDGRTPVTPKTDLFSGPGGRPTAAEANRPSIANLLKIGKVNPPKTFAESKDKVRKSSARADRAKIRVARAAE